MKKVWISAALFWLIVSALACWLYPVALYDPCARYAPMADAFAQGDFYYAFHPRFGVLFHLLTGALSAITGLQGLYCLQPVAFFFLALSGVVIFATAKRLTDSEKLAWWSFTLVLLMPDFFRYALDGLREPIKCLVFALFGYSIVSKKSWPFALGVVAYITSFTYGFVASSVLVFLWTVYWLLRHDWRKIILPIGGWVFGTGVVTVLTWAYTGHWVPAPQFIKILGRWL